MDRIRTLIVDDERMARKRIRRFLSLEPDVDVVGECANGEEALGVLREQDVDLMFLDIQMPDRDGFGTLAGMPEGKTPLVVFVTAYDEHALRAFEVHAIDYLLKPFERPRLQSALQRVRSLLQSNRAPAEDQRRLNALLDDLRERREPRDRIAIKNAGRVFFVKADDVDWIEAANNYVCIHVGHETHLLRETMSALETRLDPRRFLRIHRSTIVNVDRIKELQPWFSGDYLVMLENGAKLTLSRTYRDKLGALIGD